MRSRFPKPLIPKHESEVLGKVRKKCRSAEKAKTTAIGDIIFRDVNISSRYDKAEELEMMVDMITMVPDEMIDVVAAIECDSSAQRLFTIYVQDGGPGFYFFRDLSIFARIGYFLGGHEYHNGVNVRYESNDDQEDIANPSDRVFDFEIGIAERRLEVWNMFPPHNENLAGRNQRG
jgi:hypothetical protein